MLIKEDYIENPEGNFKEKIMLASDAHVFPCSLPVIVQMNLKFYSYDIGIKHHLPSFFVHFKLLPLG